MERYEKGDRVSLKQEALSLSYIAGRLTYTNMYEGKVGTVLGYSQTGKVAVEFDDLAFTTPGGIRSSHDNGCHGKGRVGYSWYIPEECLNFISSEPIYSKELLLLL